MIEYEEFSAKWSTEKRTRIAKFNSFNIKLTLFQEKLIKLIVFVKEELIPSRSEKSA